MHSYKTHVYCRENLKYPEKSALLFRVRHKTWKGAALEIILPWKINIKFWDLEIEEVKVPSRSKRFKELTELKFIIQEFKLKVQRYCDSNSPTRTDIGLFVEKHFGKKKMGDINAPRTLEEAGQDFIISSKGNLAPKTIIKHRTSLRLLKEFLYENDDVSSELSDLSEKFGSLYKGWAQESRTYSINYVATNLKCFNRWMKFAVELLPFVGQ